MKKVLVISYYFPPAGGPGVQRWLKFVKYLRDEGYEPVLYVPQGAAYPVTDESLAAEIPPGLTIHRGHIIEPSSVFSSGKKISAGFIDASSGKKGWKSRLMTWVRANVFIPDARMLWIRPSVRRLKKILREEGIDTLISTGPPHSTHLIALGLKRADPHLQWIADFRDPWTKIDYFHHLPLTRWARRRHFRLESEVLAQADQVIVVTPSMARDYRPRVRGRLHVITNGYDTEDLPDSPPPLDEKFTLCHVGSLNADRNPYELWEVLARLRAQNPAFRNDLRICLTGNVSPAVFETLRKNGLDDCVQHIPYAPHAQVVRSQHAARVLLMLMNRTPDGALYMAGKLFEYLAAARPILLVGFAHSDAADILRECQAGYALDFSDRKGLEEALRTLYREYRLGQDTGRKVSPQSEKYTRRALTARLAREVLACPAEHPSPEES